VRWAVRFPQTSGLPSISVDGDRAAESGFRLDSAVRVKDEASRQVEGRVRSWDDRRTEAERASWLENLK